MHLQRTNLSKQLNYLHKQCNFVVKTGHWKIISLRSINLKAFELRLWFFKQTKEKLITEWEEKSYFFIIRFLSVSRLMILVTFLSSFTKQPFGITPVKRLETRRRKKMKFSRIIWSLAKKGVTRREIIGGCTISAATRCREWCSKEKRVSGLPNMPSGQFKFACLI